MKGKRDISGQARAFLPHRALLEGYKATIQKFTQDLIQTQWEFPSAVSKTQSEDTCTSRISFGMMNPWSYDIESVMSGLKLEKPMTLSNSTPAALFLTLVMSLVQAKESLAQTSPNTFLKGCALTTSSQAARPLTTLTTSRRCGGSTGSVLSSYNRIKRCIRSDIQEPSRSTSVQAH